MGIEIVLYDRSPVTQKIFFHVLYHYGPVVHRVNRADELIKQIQFRSVDIIFIDSAFSDDQNLKSQIQKEAEGKLKNIPIILIAPKEELNQDRKPTLAKDVLQKPISAGQLRELINNFVPKTKQNILNRHLKFPDMPTFKEEPDGVGEVQKQPLQESVQPISADLSTPPVPPSKTDKVINPVVVDTDESQPKASSAHAPSIDRADNRPLDKDTGIKPVADLGPSLEKEKSIAPKEKPLSAEPPPLDKDTGIKPVADLGPLEEEKPIMSEEKTKTVSSLTPQGALKPSEPKSAGEQVRHFIEQNLQKSAGEQVRLFIEQNLQKSAGEQVRLFIEQNLQKSAREQVRLFIEQNLPQQLKTEVQQSIETTSRDIIQKTVQQAVQQVVP